MACITWTPLGVSLKIYPAEPCRTVRLTTPATLASQKGANRGIMDQSAIIIVSVGQ